MAAAGIGFSSSFRIDDVGVGRVLNMDLDELFGLCDELGIESDELVASQQLQSCVLEHMKATRGKDQNTSLAPFAETAFAFARDVDRKRRELVAVLNAAEELLQEKEGNELFRNIGLQKSSCWMQRKDFEYARKLCEGKPVLLVAGSTSAGKSTLINALLGEPILPTSYNATTSVLCEVKYSDKPELKYADLHLRKHGKIEKKRMGLGSADDQSQFASYMQQIKHTVGAGSTSCKLIEIFWPLSFLKDFTLVDSPGVTEKEGESVVRHMTEQYQRNCACGCIYVLDSTRSAQEAGQVGGLLRAISDSINSQPPPLSALFVLNKWDLLEQQQTDEEQKEFKGLIAKHIADCWPGFQHSKQLVTMNARLALQAQELGQTTKDMDVLCRRIADMLPVTFDSLLYKSLRQLMLLMYTISDMLDATIRCLHLPVEERREKQRKDWEELNELRKSVEHGKLASVRDKVINKLEELVLVVGPYLESDESLQTVEEAKKSRLEYWPSDIKGAIKEATIVAICEHPHYKTVCLWIQKELLHKVEDLCEELSFYPHTGSYSRTSQVTHLIDVDTIAAQANLTLPAVYVITALSAIGAMMVARISGNSSGLDAMTSISDTVKNWKCSTAVVNGYRKLVARLKKDDYKELKEVLEAMLVATVPTVKLLLQDIPKHIDAQEQFMTVRLKQQVGDLGKFEQMLCTCLPVTMLLSHFALELFYGHSVQSNLFECEENLVGEYHFGLAYTNKNSALGKVVIVINEETIKQKSSDIWWVCQFRMQNQSKLRHVNIAQFFSVVCLQSDPLRLGLVAEDCGSKSLYDAFIGNSACNKNEKSISLQQTADVIKQLLEGLKHLHDSAHVMHGRLQLKSIWLVNDLVKIDGFGRPWTICDIDEMKCDQLVYLAPEVKELRTFDMSVDMYSAGVILWEIWSGQSANTIAKACISEKTFSAKLLEFSRQQEKTESLVWKANKLRMLLADLTEMCCSAKSTERPVAAKALSLVKSCLNSCSK